ncbi:MAG: DUF4870 domain-containing protein [Armatimonadetes bacterium]|nr:DUF4870 domain-containing protein [Armatimonadota bacterium]
MATLLPPHSGAGPSARERNWAVAAHLSGSLLSVFLANWGLLGLIGPLIVWLIEKDQSAYIADQAKEALNFQLTILIAALIFGLAGTMLTLVTCGVGSLIVVPAAILVFGALLILDLVFGILAGLAASNGQYYRYPFVVRLVS